MNIHDKFDLYIDGLLSKEEREEMEKQFLLDHELLREFKQYLEINRHLSARLNSPILDYEDDMILDEINLIDRLKIDQDVDEYSGRPVSDEETELYERIKSLYKKKKQKKISIKSVLSNPFFKIAAVILLATIIPLTVWNKIRPLKNQMTGAQIYEKYFNPYDDKSLRSNDSYHVLMQQALIDFRNDDFLSANTNLNLISADYDTDYMYHILKGLIYIQKAEPDSAKEFLRTAMTASESENRLVAEWYLGLLLMKENDIRDAVPLFLELSNQPNPYKREAKKILNSVKLH